MDEGVVAERMLWSGAKTLKWNLEGSTVLVTLPGLFCQSPRRTYGWFVARIRARSLAKMVALVSLWRLSAVFM